MSDHPGRSPPCGPLLCAEFVWALYSPSRAESQYAAARPVQLAVPLCLETLWWSEWMEEELH